MEKRFNIVVVALVGLYGVLAGGSASARPWRQADWIAHSVCAQSCLEVVEIATPPGAEVKDVALLVPGFTQNANTFDLWPERGLSFARHLMRRFGMRVYILNARGIGNSPRVAHSSMDDIAIEDIPRALEFVYRREGRKVVLMGHSQGGITLLASLGGLTRQGSDAPYFSKEKAAERQAMVRGAVAIASNVTMRSELGWHSLFRHIIKLAYHFRGFLARHHDWIDPAALGGPALQRLLHVARWGAWDFLYSVKRVAPEIRDRVQFETVDGTSAGILNQFTTAMVVNRADRGVQAVNGPYYWEGLGNLADVPVSTIFFELDSMARPGPGYEDTFERIASPRKHYLVLPGLRHEDFAILPGAQDVLDPAIGSVLED